MIKSVLLLTLIFTSLSTLAAGNAENGAKIYKKINCTSCHKKDGLGKAKKQPNGEFKLGGMFGPRIAGLDENYIIEQMTAIKDGKRKTKYTVSMKLKIKKLTAQDIADVSAFVSTTLGAKSGKYKSEVWPRK